MCLFYLLVEVFVLGSVRNRFDDQDGKKAKHESQDEAFIRSMHRQQRVERDQDKHQVASQGRKQSAIRAQERCCRSSRHD